MCGICGIVSKASAETLAETVDNMANTLRHRGPDAAGIWVDREAGVAIGHRRLSILDLSPAGAQPMISTCERYVIAFNGEIYNHLDLRADLDQRTIASAWRGNSDTETLLAAIVHWGLREAVHRAHGMFALALWDRQEKRLHFMRDRMGEKPLYLARLSDGWAFGSELKAILAVPGFEARLCRDAVAAFLAYGYVPETHCIFEGIQKISPGCVTSVSLEASPPEIQDYETFQDLLENGLRRRTVQLENGLERLEEVLRTVVEEQMLSDVPLGCFLSGGVDSSLVAALMQRRSAQPVRTFAIGFSEARFNEAPHAAAVAQHLGTDHTEFILSEQDALGVITTLPEIYDEPFADSSQIPTVLLCREARKVVTVALTGDGGDEVFGGYNRYVFGPQLLSRLQRVPRGLRRSAGQIVSAVAPKITSEDGWLRRVASRMQLPVTALDKAAKLSPHLGDIDDLPALYQFFTRGIHDPEHLMSGTTAVTIPEISFPLKGAEWLMAMDTVTYLPGDILVKVDRAAMAASLETRAPFLDSRVITAAWGLPPEAKMANGIGKHVLRSILDRHVPRDLIERPKQGFAVPLDRWLRGDLRDWAEELLSDDTLFGLAGLKPIPVRELWTCHQAGSVNNGTKLWTILMLLAWLNQYRHHFVVPQSADTRLSAC
ncbi:asparagine synthase (glutamine-hydrolyzing) [Hoeflea sp. WL0058]|uniref:asparagine synthase (glutamine-hydrolyzing) n=1 Tax=Flavimaribacter sediminis TaxID=2865987 RepID=A0AAE2ZGL0_9HYPH|nr:asparagine synthase (glutamine-hydrolyzing) [Flavimaribacter sediminis]MBW8636198.1 asparagine synthase (glutamine-hydrolyzing) [Flavimaribacter sediminis]